MSYNKPNYKAKSQPYETENYMQFKELFTSAGLEFNIVEGKDEPDGFISAFGIKNSDGKIIAGATIAKRKNCFVLHYIAVEKSLRGKGIGENLLKVSMNKIRDLGGLTVYITAKGPKFFEKYGFKYLEKNEVPDIFSCSNCKQYAKSCHPKFMIYKSQNNTFI